jgi:hypothetical protein
MYVENLNDCYLTESDPFVPGHRSEFGLACILAVYVRNKRGLGEWNGIAT